MKVRQTLGGRYELLDQLGRGGMAVVWRARDNVLGRAVAVKLLDGPNDDDPLSRRAIRDEARAAAKLSHPNIAQVHDFGESDLDGRCTPYVVMELVPGRTLTQHMMDGPVPPEAAFQVCAEVAAALAAAHADGIVHRDIKPANVIVTPTGAKVVDFGIAAAISPGGAPGEPVGDLVGTPAYLAPERLTGDAVEPASDVYALGVILYRLLAGHSPWTAETTTRMLAAHIYVDPMPLPTLAGVPAQVTALVNRCLSKDPTRRPHAREMADLLTRVGGVRLTDPDRLPAPRIGGGDPVATEVGPVARPASASDMVWPAAPQVDRAGGISPELVAVRRASPGADGMTPAPDGVRAGRRPGQAPGAASGGVPSPRSGTSVPGASHSTGPSSAAGPGSAGPGSAGPGSAGPGSARPGRGGSGPGGAGAVPPERRPRRGRRLFAVAAMVAVVVTAAATVWMLAPTGTFPSLVQRRKDMAVVVPPPVNSAPTASPAPTGADTVPTPEKSSTSATRTSEPAGGGSAEPEEIERADDARPTRTLVQAPTAEATHTEEEEVEEEREYPAVPDPVDPPEVVDPQPVVRTLSTRGGSVRATCRSGGDAEILNAEPDGRFKIKDLFRGPSSAPEVVFRLGLYTERLTVTCADGEPRKSVDRSFR